MWKYFIGSGKGWYGFAFALAFLASPWAWAGIAAPAVGGGPDRPDPNGNGTAFHGGLHTDPPFADGWSVGSPTSRMLITADPAAPNWIKVLQTPQGLLTGFALDEFLRVGPGPAWTDWHERIVTPGWQWGGEDTLTAGTSPFVLGIRTDTDSDGLFETLSFFFDPLAPGTDVTIEKDIVCGLPNGCTGEPVPGHGFGILVREFPTVAVVPVPGTLLLLAGGLAGLAALRRRRD